YVSAALAAARHWISTARTVTVTGTDNLTAETSATSLGGRLEIGRRFAAPWLDVGVTPFAAVQGQIVRTPTYSEIAASGTAAFALAYDGHTSSQGRSELGAWFDRSL